MSDENKTYAIDMPDLQRERWIDLLKMGAQTSFSEMLEWGRETIKHLIIINGAGLAGSATLSAASTVLKSGSGAVGYAALSFVVGLVAAFFVMVWRWQINATESERQFIFLHDFESSRKSIEESDQPFVSRVWVRGVTYFLSGLSFVAFLMGAYLISAALRTVPEPTEPEVNSVFAYRFQLPPDSGSQGDFSVLRRHLSLGASY